MHITSTITIPNHMEPFPSLKEPLCQIRLWLYTAGKHYQITVNTLFLSLLIDRFNFLQRKCLMGIIRRENGIEP